MIPRRRENRIGRGLLAAKRSGAGMCKTSTDAVRYAHHILRPRSSTDLVPRSVLILIEPILTV